MTIEGQNVGQQMPSSWENIIIMGDVFKTEFRCQTRIVDVIKIKSIVWHEMLRNSSHIEHTYCWTTSSIFHLRKRIKIIKEPVRISIMISKFWSRRHSLQIWNLKSKDVPPLDLKFVAWWSSDEVDDVQGMSSHQKSGWHVLESENVLTIILWISDLGPSVALWSWLECGLFKSISRHLQSNEGWWKTVKLGERWKCTASQFLSSRCSLIIMNRI